MRNNVTIFTTYIFISVLFCLRTSIYANDDPKENEYPRFWVNGGLGIRAVYYLPQ